MDEKQLLALQKLIIEYFKDTSDDDFVAFVDSFVYYKPAKNNATSKMIEGFLKVNGLEKSYLNYVLDQRDPNKFFKRASMSDATMIDGVKWSLLNAGFNRLRNATESVKLREKIKTEHKEMKQLISTLMDAGTNDRYHETLDDMRDLYLGWQR
jgi:hypothetical protein